MEKCHCCGANVSHYDWPSHFLRHLRELSPPVNPALAEAKLGGPVALNSTLYGWSSKEVIELLSLYDFQTLTDRGRKLSCSGMERLLKDHYDLTRSKRRDVEELGTAIANLVLRPGILMHLSPELLQGLTELRGCVKESWHSRSEERWYEGFTYTPPPSIKDAAEAEAKRRGLILYGQGVRKRYSPPSEVRRLEKAKARKELWDTWFFMPLRSILVVGMFVGAYILVNFIFDLIAGVFSD